jgi:glycosyltransferase involved in cell wall biosynthesis
VDEVVSDGETGILTKAESGEMADAAIGLLLDAGRRASMGQAARRLVEARFAAPRQTAAMVARYEALLARRP